MLAIRKAIGKAIGPAWRRTQNTGEGGSMYPLGLISLWNAKTPTISKVGPQIVTSAAGTQPDADGNMVPWPVNHPGKGVMVQPAYTQLAVNSVLDGAIGGSPGTTPTGWTYTVVDSPTMAVADVEGENKLTFSGTASRGYLSLSQAVAALAVYTFDVMVTTDGVLRYADFEYCSLTGGTIVVMKDGVVVADETAVPAAGTFKLSVKVTAGAVGDTAIFRFGLGASAVATGTVSVWQPQLVLGAYSLPYVRSTTGSVPVPSTAATAANGLAIPLNAAMTAALSAGGAFTAAALYWVGAGNAIIPVSGSAILSASNSTIRELYKARNTLARAYDGVTIAEAGGSSTWARGEIHLQASQTNTARTHFRSGYRRYTASMTPITGLVWGNWAVYDGSMGPGTHLRFGYSLEWLIGFLQTQLWNKSASETEILRVMETAL